MGDILHVAASSSGHQLVYGPPRAHTAGFNNSIVSTPSTRRSCEKEAMQPLKARALLREPKSRARTAGFAAKEFAPALYCFDPLEAADGFSWSFSSSVGLPVSPVCDARWALEK